MPLTTSDTFQEITLRLVQVYYVDLYYRLSDGTRDRLSFYNGDIPSGHAQRADLDVLQEIYASADGFRDADGNAVAIKLNDFARGGLTIFNDAALEINGFVNPLINGSYDRLANMLAVLGALLLEGSVNADSVTNRPGVTSYSRADLSPKRAPRKAVPFKSRWPASISLFSTATPSLPSTCFLLTKPRPMQRWAIAPM